MGVRKYECESRNSGVIEMMCTSVLFSARSLVYTREFGVRNPKTYISLRNNAKILRHDRHQDHQKIQLLKSRATNMTPYSSSPDVAGKHTGALTTRALRPVGTGSHWNTNTGCVHFSIQTQEWSGALGERSI
ncbi:hypothetical protein EVAR_37608_1 [Eumeta japonica]|uniref:Uncharacterized protein n=1 Tax=Eumeta variegata TaxID=151549 RepID=A0A4C1VPB8_EUMVA|nr:hypothetical protein EVAR_37608_1 [Eumeta japonica]